MPTILNAARSFLSSKGLPCDQIDESHVGTHFAHNGRYYRAVVSEQVDDDIAFGVLVMAGLGRVPHGKVANFAVAALSYNRTGLGKVLLDNGYLMLALDLLGRSGSYDAKVFGESFDALLGRAPEIESALTNVISRRNGQGGAKASAEKRPSRPPTRLEREVEEILAGATADPQGNSTKPSAADKKGWAVILLDAGPTKAIAIKWVRERMQLGLKEAHELVEKTPVKIASGLSKDEAAEIVRQLESAGLKVELRMVSKS